MSDLTNIYKKLILFTLLLACFGVIVPSYAVEEMSELEVMESEVGEQVPEVKNSYINDIEILGANIIKPEFVLSKLKLQRGDLYDKDVMQQDLKTIYKLGYFTERMKAVPIKNENGTISLKIIVEENIPVTDFTIEGKTVVSTEELMKYLIPLKGKPQNISDINTAMEKINECYMSKGYILSKVDSVYDDPDGVLNLSITEGKINKITISGNEKTKDFIVERNIMTEPGSVYNENIVKQDLVRLYSTQAESEIRLLLH